MSFGPFRISCVSIILKNKFKQMYVCGFFTGGIHYEGRREVWYFSLFSLFFGCLSQSFSEYFYYLCFPGIRTGQNRLQYQDFDSTEWKCKLFINTLIPPGSPTFSLLMSNNHCNISHITRAKIFQDTAELIWINSTIFWKDIQLISSKQ